MSPIMRHLGESKESSAGRARDSVGARERRLVWVLYQVVRGRTGQRLPGEVPAAVVPEEGAPGLSHQLVHLWDLKVGDVRLKTCQQSSFQTQVGLFIHSCLLLSLRP